MTLLNTIIQVSGAQFCTTSTVLCVHHCKSSLRPSPFISTIAFSTSSHAPTPKVTTLMSVFMSFSCFFLLSPHLLLPQILWLFSSSVWLQCFLYWPARSCWSLAEREAFPSQLLSLYPTLWCFPILHPHCIIKHSHDKQFSIAFKIKNIHPEANRSSHLLECALTIIRYSSEAGHQIAVWLAGW